MCLFIYCFVSLYAKLTREHTDYWKGEKKKTTRQYVLRETVVSIVHSLFVCVCGNGMLASETFKTQEQNPSINRAFRAVGGGTLFHIMIRYHQ